MTHIPAKRLICVLAAACFALRAGDASAQLDPLLFLKRVAPNVILMVDVRATMLRDADNTYYDPNTYSWKNNGGDAAWQAALGLVQGSTISNSSGTYRRKFSSIAMMTGSVNGKTYNYTANTITAVGNLQSGYSTFYEKTRIMVARRALAQIVNENTANVRFGLLKTRQTTPSWGSGANDDALVASSPNPTDTGKTAVWDLTKNTVIGFNSGAPGSTAIVSHVTSTSNSSVLTGLATTSGVQGTLIPASGSTSALTDAPLANMLDDAKTEATSLITADTLCRNTVVVLVVAGGEGNSATPATSAQVKASSFTNISGRRVPIYVVAIAPPAGDVANLTAIATNSGGQYIEITKAQIDAVTAGSVVPEMVKGINRAIQHSFSRYTEFNSGTASEFQVTSPIIGTVNLDGAKDLSGATLPDTSIENPTTHVAIPQRSNLMVTTAFALPGFDGKLRAFRVYKPATDSTKPSGYKFVKDGTKLWVACAPGTTTSTPCSSLTTASRNIYTSLPDGTVVKFDSSNAATLAPYLAGAASAPAGFDAAGLIDTVRALPLGTIVSSTPAIMDSPSVDPPPDADYPAFAADNVDRRSIVWVTANDGMLHAIDARLGVEVWAFIPFNLLPKLRTVRDGISVSNFDYLFDGSAKIADVKIDGAWRTMLIVGEGAGGTFYQAFDVTLAGMADVVEPTSDTPADVLSFFNSTSRVPLSWTFPRYSVFDHTINTTAAPYGDLGSSATAVEKSVGQTWSDPAVGQAIDSSGKYVVIVGSGFLPYSQQTGTARGGASAPVAGTTLYLLNAKTGAVYDSRSVGSDGLAETVDNCAATSVNNCQVMKNALQADPVATGPPDSRYITKAYIGDLDGRVWRFNIGLSSGNPVFSSNVNLYNASLVAGHGNSKKANATQPIFSSMAAVNVGGTQQYIFLGTGSDLLPSNGVTQQYQLIGFLDNGTTGVETFSYSLSSVANSTGNEEKVTAFPAVAGDIVFFTTTTFHPATTCVNSDANLYAFTYTGGAAYDTNGDDRITNQDSTKVVTVAGARATAPFVVDQHLVFGAGNQVEVFGDAQDFNNGVGQVGVRILTWREVR